MTDYQNEILDLYDDAKNEGLTVDGRRSIRWRFIRGLVKDLTPDFMRKIRENIKTSFYSTATVNSYQLRNIEDGTIIVYYNNYGSPWFDKLSKAEDWLSEQEEKRLDYDNIKRPSTKWDLNCENHFALDARRKTQEGPPQDHKAADGGEGNQGDGEDLERHQV